jgi:hypothetical protein
MLNFGPAVSIRNVGILPHVGKVSCREQAGAIVLRVVPVAGYGRIRLKEYPPGTLVILPRIQVQEARVMASYGFTVCWTEWVEGFDELNLFEFESLVISCAAAAQRHLLEVQVKQYADELRRTHPDGVCLASALVDLTSNLADDFSAGDLEVAADLLQKIINEV